MIIFHNHKLSMISYNTCKNQSQQRALTHPIIMIIDQSWPISENNDGYAPYVYLCGDTDDPHTMYS